MRIMKKWRRHTVEFKRQVVERMKTSENIGQLARELDLQRKLLYSWISIQCSNCPYILTAPMKSMSNWR